MKRVSYFLLLFLIVNLVLMFENIKDIEATESFLGDFNYRQPHNITGSLGNYPIFFNVWNGSGSSSGNIMYLDGHCNSFPDDINFTDNDNNPYPCWMEDYNSTWARIWVNVTSPTTNMYVYYGSSTQTTFGNDLDNVWDVWYDPDADSGNVGDDPDSSIWTITDDETDTNVSICEVSPKFGNRTIQYYDEASGGYARGIMTVNEAGIRVILWINLTHTDKNFGFPIQDGGSGDSIQTYFMDDGNIKHYNGSWNTIASYSANQWYRLETVSEASNGYFNIKIDDAWYNERDIQGSPSTWDRVMFTTGTSPIGYEVYHDKVVSGKYDTDEGADQVNLHGDWGSEEEEGEPNPPEQVDWSDVTTIGRLYPAAQRQGAYYKGTYERTYVAYMTSSQKIYVCYFNHERGQRSESVEIATTPDADFHRSPDILVTDDGKIHVFYGCHSDELYYRRSTNAENISSWTSPVTISYDATYPNSIKMPNTSNILIFYRCGGELQDSRGFKKSQSGGVNWGSENVFLYGGTPYCSAARVDDQDRIYYTWRYDGGDSIYFAYSNDEGEHWYNQTGDHNETAITSAEADSYYKVYDASGDLVDLPNVAMDENQIPYIVFAEKDAGNWKYYWLYKWSTALGGYWAGYQVANDAPSSKPRTDIDVINSTDIRIYRPKDVDGTLEVQEWNSTSGGSWTKLNDITKNSVYDSYYPLLVKNGTSEIKVIFSQGASDAECGIACWGTITGGIENFNTYEETDTGNNRIRVTPISTVINFTCLRNETTYAYGAYNESYFTDWRHWTRVKLISIESSAYFFHWMLTNDTADVKSLNDNNKNYLALRFYNNSYLDLVEYYGGNSYVNSTSFQFTLNTSYYLETYKSGTSLTLKIYSNADRSTFLETRTLTLQANYTFRYVFAANSYNDGNTQNASGINEYFELDPPYKGESYEYIYVCIDQQVITTTQTLWSFSIFSSIISLFVVGLLTGFSFSILSLITPQFTVSFLKGASFNLMKLIQQTLSMLLHNQHNFSIKTQVQTTVTVISHFFKESMQNLFGSISQQVNVILQRTHSFFLYSTVGNMLTVSFLATFAFTLFSVINPHFAVSSIKSFTFSLMPVIQQIFTLVHQNQYVFNLSTQIQGVLTITTQFFAGPVKSFFGIINQQISVAFQRVYGFVLESTIGNMFTVGFLATFALTLFSTVNPTLGINIMRSLSFNLTPVILQAVAIVSQRTWSFSLFTEIQSNFSVAGHFFTGAVKTFFGSINQQVSVSIKKAWSFTLQSTLNSALTVGVVTSFSFTVMSLINPVFTIGIVKSVSLGFVSAIQQVWMVLQQNQYAFSISPQIQPTFSATLGTSIIYAVLSLINSQFAISFTKTVDLSIFSIVNQAVTVANQNAWAFSLFASVNPTFLVKSLFQYSATQIKNIWGTISQTVTASTTTTLNFRIHGFINKTIVTVGSFTIPNVVNLFALIAVTSITVGLTDLASSAETNLALVLAGFAAVMAIIALTFGLTRRRERET